MTGLPPLGETQEAPPLDFFSSVAVMAPRGRDETVARQLLAKDGIASISVLSLTQLSELISQHIGAVLITEEALSGADADALALALDSQPSWSDVPFIVLANGTTGSRSERAAQRIDTLSNAVLLSRPLHAEELIRAVRSSLTARGRQHQARRQLEELQLRERQLFESEAKFQAIANSVDQMIWSTLPDGFHDYFNDRWYEFTGVPAGSTDGEGWNGIFHPDDQERAWERWRHSLSTGENYEIEYRLRHRSGDYRWVLGRAQPVLDKDGTILRWYGSCTDIHEIKVAEEQRHLMLGEMNHRVKNTLAMVNVMVSQTLRLADNLRDAQTSLQSRIAMMAQAHDRLIATSWAETRLPEVVDAALAAHRTGEGRFDIEGPDLEVGSKQALAMTMAIHELSTNASKYGSLSAQGGKVRICWAKKDDVFTFTWVETDGPRVSPPTKRGFGSRMIEQALAGYFQGKVELSYDPEGLNFKLSAPGSGLLL